MREERQVKMIMVHRMIKMKTMKPKRLTELITCLLRDRYKDVGYNHLFLTMPFNFYSN